MGFINHLITRGPHLVLKYHGSCGSSSSKHGFSKGSLKLSENTGSFTNHSLPPAVPLSSDLQLPGSQCNNGSPTLCLYMIPVLYIPNLLWENLVSASAGFKSGSTRRDSLMDSLHIYNYHQLSAYKYSIFRTFTTYIPHIYTSTIYSRSTKKKQHC